jgi:hypothetical protein
MADKNIFGKITNDSGEIGQRDDNVVSVTSAWSSSKITDEIGNGTVQFNQSLNSWDSVTFAEITVGDTGGFSIGYALPTARGQAGQVLTSTGSLATWETPPPAADQELNQTSQVTFQTVDTLSLRIGDTSTTGYRLPSIRGAAGQILTTESSTAFPKWVYPADPYNQQLNTTNNVVFNAATVDSLK